MAKKKQEKILIGFNTLGHQSAYWKHKKYAEAVDEAISLIETETGLKITPEIIREGRAFEWLQKQYADIHEANNTLKLKPIKLMELMDVNVNAIILKLDGLKMHPVKDEPTKEQYSYYAETPEQIERYETCKTALDMLAKMNLKHLLDLRNPRQFDSTKAVLQPAVSYVLYG